MKRLVILGVVVLVGTLSAPLQALEMNQRQGLGPAEQVKVNKALARPYVPVNPNAKGQTSALAGKSVRGCGNTQIGTVTGVKNTSRVESIVAVRGDIITVNRNVRCP